MTRLSRASLSSLKEGVHTPGYEPEEHKSSIVHLGVGAFHRSHQAWYTHKVLEKFGGDWRITGVSLRSPGVRDTLQAQDCLYTVAVKANEGNEYHIMGSISSMLVAPENPAVVIDLLADKATKVVTLTITEKGYCLNNSTGELELNTPDIAHDLKALHAPKTAIGYLVAALQKRMDNATGKLTIISCDNLAGNGIKLEAAVTGFAKAVSEPLAAWIADNVTFPSTMVDRIAPATTDEDKVALTKDIGVEDQACVMTEPFTQWVIEDNFAGPVPPWDKVGATYTADVEPFEDMKLRLLNASHSTIAYLGCLAGYPFVSEAMSDDAFKALIGHMMMKELAPTLHVPDGFDVDGYAKSLLERFSNRGLPHKTRQIAMDGSQKIPQRILPALMTQLKEGGPIEGLTLAVAGWIRYTQGVEEDGTEYSVDDPMAEIFTAMSSLKGKARIEEMLSLEDVFAPELKNDTILMEKLEYWLAQLAEKGAKKTVEEHFLR